MCVCMHSQYLETVLKIPRRDVCLAQLIVCVRQNISKPATVISLHVYKSTCSDWENCQIAVSNHNNKHKNVVAQTLRLSNYIFTIKLKTVDAVSGC